MMGRPQPDGEVAFRIDVIYVVTRGTSDYPDDFVLRRHVMMDGDLVADYRPLAIARTLEDIRKLLPPDVRRFEPWDADDPVIAEWWA